MKSEKLKNSCFRSKKVKLKKFIPHRWLELTCIAYNINPEYNEDIMLKDTTRAGGGRKN